MERVYQTAHQAGVRTILTGIFSDHMYAGAHYWLRDLLVDRRFALAVPESVWYMQRQGLGAFFKDCLLHACVNKKLIRCVRPLKPPHWLTDRAKALLPESGSWSPSAQRGRRPVQHERVLGLRAARSASFDIFHASHSAVELRHPYRDRRLIEFMLSVPAHQLYRHGLYKPILRNAMQGVLPERIRRRRHPTSLAALFFRGLAERERTTVDELLNDGYFPTKERKVSQNLGKCRKNKELRKICVLVAERSFPPKNWEQGLKLAKNISF